MDVKVRNKKTNEVKTVPIKVYESLKHLYVLIENEMEFDQDVKKNIGQSQNAQPVVVDFNPAVIVENGIATEIQRSENPEIGNMANEYEELSGKKPDGRWSEEKLKTKIEELKNATNESK